MIAKECAVDLLILADHEQEQLCAHLCQIGNTPIKEVYFVIDGRPRKVHLKLEGTNPGGSIKVRTAYALVSDLERHGLLQKGSVILESTSGNLGVALSMIARARGYGFLAIVDPKATEENVARIRSFGAEVHMVDQVDEAGGYLLARLACVRQYCEQSSQYVWTNQYTNPANPAIHYRETGPEIYRQMKGHIDAIFVAVSTGGTLAGIGRYLRAVSPRTQIIGVDAHGSVIFGSPPAPRKLTGIGSSRLSDFITGDAYDSYLLVRDEEAFAFCHALHESTGIKVGGSSGAVLAACARYLAEHPDVNETVCVCPDTGDNYSSSIYNAQWLARHDLLLAGGLGRVERIL